MTAIYQLRGGLLIDGLGTDPVTADLEIGGDRIIRIGEVDSPRSDVSVLNLEGCWVVPGFVDVHSHADFAVFDPQRSALRHAAGVTTEVVGQDGIGPVPCEPRIWNRVTSQLTAVAGLPTSGPWPRYEDYLAACRVGAHSRVTSFASHGTIRRHVVGEMERPATEAELRRMTEIASTLAADGMPGLSSGLSYPPARASGEAEVSAVYRPFAERGRPYVTHLRDYGEGLDEALEEAARIAEGGWLHLSHLHLSGPGRDGVAPAYLDWIDAVRKRGTRVTFDTYPYTAACTFLTSFLPSAAHEAEDLPTELRDYGAAYAAILDDRGPGQTVAVGWDGFRLMGAVLDGEQIPDDTSLTDVAGERRRSPGEVVVDLCLENPEGLAVLIEQGHNSNIRALVADAGHTGGSDGIMGAGVPHPRATGTFLRFLARAHRGELPVTLPEMVARLTARAAAVIAAEDLGVLRAGALADLAVIDPARLEDGPDRRRFAPDAVRWLFVGGTLVRSQGRPTAAVPGAVVA